MGDSKRRATARAQSAAGETKRPIEVVFLSLDPKLVEHLKLEQEVFCQQYAGVVEQIRNTYSQFLPTDQVEQLVRDFERNPQTRELIAFATAQIQSLKLLPPIEEDDEFLKEDYRCTFWEIGRWDGAWDDPDCEQEWKGDPTCGEYLSLDQAIEELIAWGVLDVGKRQQVEVACLSVGEYWQGDEEQAGWSIQQAEEAPTHSNPNAPLWVLLDRGEYQSPTGQDASDAAILEPFRVDWMEWHGQVLLRGKTLAEVLDVIHPNLSWDDPQYQQIWMERIASLSNGYFVRSPDNHRWQISREQSPQEAKENPPHF